MSVRLPPNRLLLLDTNVLVHLLRAREAGQQLDAALGLRERRERPLLSTIVEAETRQFATRRKWGEDRQQRLRALLANLVPVSAGLPQVIDNWIEIATAQEDAGRKIGENDLWIATRVRAAGAILVTCDGDFLKLVPGLVAVCHIETTPFAVTLHGV